MEIWGGSGPATRGVSTPGLDLWVYSEPYHGNRQGGDVYYVTLCGGGVVTRIAVADVSGHGASASEFSTFLRTLLRKNINEKSQTKLVERLNQQFGEKAELSRFATALIVTYLATDDRMSVSNAGHPNPLIYRRRTKTWTMLRQGETECSERPGDLPLGLSDDTDYSSLDVTLEPGDIVAFYTDALTEAADPAGHMLGESGLLEIARGLEIADGNPAAFGSSLLEAIRKYRGGLPADDDITLVVSYHNASASPRLTIAQKVDVYAKFFGFKPV
jgi:serine phosphatase RsbU (regulator of sigma subunit)